MKILILKELLYKAICGLGIHSWQKPNYSKWFTNSYRRCWRCGLEDLVD